jgi:hypoxanthine phosphoribosyltransferase
MAEPGHTIHPVLTPEQIQARVAELGEQLSRDFQGEEPIFLGVLNGAFIFLSDLVRHMRLPVQVDFVRLASYGASTTSSGQIRITKDCELDLTGRCVLVVEDIVDTGLTLHWLAERLRARGPRQLKLCALIDKPERRQCDLHLDYVGFHIPRGFLVGYGLDYNEQYRYLPGIGELHFGASEGPQGHERRP